MKRRHVLLAALGLPLAARADDLPWNYELLTGGFDGQAWNLGFKVNLDPGWKTYWRVPGEGGIAPDIKLVGENLKSFDVLLPLPTRFRDAAGMTIGFKDKVVFPLRLVPAVATKSVLFQFNAFFGVCDVVCIPAQVALEAAVDPSNSAMPGQPEISRWLARVPKVAENGPVASAKAVLHGGKPALELTLQTTVDDVFVEGSPLHYFGAPEFTENRAVLVASGAKSPEELKARPLRITLSTQGQGLEQTVMAV